jgi:hypothetical protein
MCVCGGLIEFGVVLVTILYCEDNGNMFHSSLATIFFLGQVWHSIRALYSIPPANVF